ncbi:MAG: 30S ribosomal protein S18 [Phycisphaerae bacterium]
MARENGNYHTKQRFADRQSKEWIGPIVDYKEIDVLRKFLTPTSKIMSRKRAGTSAQEQRALKQAVKRARFLALVAYAGQ